MVRRSATAAVIRPVDGPRQAFTRQYRDLAPTPGLLERSRIVMSRPMPVAGRMTPARAALAILGSLTPWATARSRRRWPARAAWPARAHGRSEGADRLTRSMRPDRPLGPAWPRLGLERPRLALALAHRLAAERNGTGRLTVAGHRTPGPAGDRAQPDRLGSDRSVGRETLDDLDRDLRPEERLDLPEQLRLVDADERDRVAVHPGPGGPADPVEVVLGDHRQLEVHDVGQRVDVDPARGDVGRDEDRHPAGLEVGQRADPLRLALVAVDRGRRDAVPARAARPADPPRASSG